MSLKSAHADDAKFNVEVDPAPAADEQESLRSLLGRRFVAHGLLEAREKSFVMRLPVAKLRAAREASKPDEAVALIVGNDVGGGAAWSLEQLATLPQEKRVATERDGTAVEYEGVPLATLLARSGVEIGESRRGQKVPAYVLASASDGYRALFSLAEVDPFLTNSPPILAIHLQGEQIPDTIGPLRIVAQADKHPRRWVRQVTHIEVRLAEPESQEQRNSAR
jgi:hypothetical protein